MKFLKYSCVLSEATTLLCCCSWKETARLLPGLRVRVGGGGDPAGLQCCPSRRAGDLRYPLRPTHPDGRPLPRRPGCAAGQTPLGPGVRTGGPREALREPEAPRRGSDWAGGPHPSPAAAPPHSGEGRRGRWLLPPPRGQVRLMLQPGARARARARSPGRPPPLLEGA